MQTKHQNTKQQESPKQLINENQQIKHKKAIQPMPVSTKATTHLNQTTTQTSSMHKQPFQKEHLSSSYSLINKPKSTKHHKSK